MVNFHADSDVLTVAVHRGHMLPKRIDEGEKCQKQFLEIANSILTRVSLSTLQRLFLDN